MPHDKKQNGNVDFVEKTRAQTFSENVRIIDFSGRVRSQVISSFGQELSSPLVAAFETYRLMRKHPTLALARSAIAAPILAGSWGMESSDELPKAIAESRMKFIMDQFFPLRERIVESSVLGGIDFGYQPFELVYEASEGQTILSKAKPLLQDITTILIDIDTGAFAGYEQSGLRGDPVTLEPKYTLNIPFRVEGTNWYGQSLLENARESYNQWNEANKGAERYDAKLAGSHFVVKYPIGTSIVNGTNIDNSSIAEDILDALESSGSIVIPNSIASFASDLSSQNSMWIVEILEDKQSRQPGFTDRLNYLDKMLVRSLLMPERAVVEGQFGTKAESLVHTDLAVEIVQIWDRMIVSMVNHFAVDRILEINFGPEARGTVSLTAALMHDINPAASR